MDISKRLAENEAKKKNKKNKAKNKLQQKIDAANLKPSCVTINKKEKESELIISPPFWKTVSSITLMFSSIEFPLTVLSIAGLLVYAISQIAAKNYQVAALLVPVCLVLAAMLYILIKVAYSSVKIVITNDGHFAVWTWRRFFKSPNYIGKKQSMDIEMRDRYYNFYKAERWSIFLGYSYLYIYVRGSGEQIDLYDYMFNKDDAKLVTQFFKSRGVKIKTKND